MDEGEPPTRAYFRDLWYAAVSVIEMCVKDDRTGMATGIGEHSFSYPNGMDPSGQFPLG